ncbi:hypothetical protein PGTUg99_011205 [Puccinia graminis f. sp. tritici]|uniref:Uncharacterized protein n=1 Tax=Puccinia graminis f. sp. tritici TaxID=56615 RepID=A0A5B0M8D8_PUCGR|nr:hypothetical protein PGTUg99_011205 [Puccinia graminis f. sp. tritici]
MLVVPLAESDKEAKVVTWINSVTTLASLSDSANGTTNISEIPISSRILQQTLFHGDYNELAFDNLHNTPFASLSTLLKSFNTDLPILEAHVTKDAANDALELSLEAIEGKSPARSQIEVPGRRLHKGG